MEAVLEAVERTPERQERGAAAARQPARFRRWCTAARKAAVPLPSIPKTLSKILRTELGANTLIQLKLDGGGDARVLVKEYQIDPVTHQLLHADFYRVAMDKLLRVTVTVVPRGEPKGVKQQGGVLDIVHRQIEIECLPADIPAAHRSGRQRDDGGQSVRVRDIATDAEVEGAQRSGHDADARHHSEGRGSGAPRLRRRPRPRRLRRRSPKSSRRARRTRLRARKPQPLRRGRKRRNRLGFRLQASGFRLLACRTKSPVNASKRRQARQRCTERGGGRSWGWGPTTN